MAKIQASLLALLLPAALPAGAAALSGAQALTIQQITSVFENGTPDFSYGYIEDIDDGAGVTCGRVGFTSGELLKLTERYTAAKGDNPLAAYLPCLRAMGDAISRDYSCLFPSVPREELATPGFKKEGGLISRADFGAAWTAAASDPEMRKLQDAYVDETYFRPALDEAAKLGLRSPLAAAFVYDAMVQMDTEPLFRAVGDAFAAGHSGRREPGSAAEEAEWMRLYVPARKRQLSTTEAGAATTPRVDSLAQILDSGDLDLRTPLEFTYFGERFTLTGPR